MFESINIYINRCETRTTSCEAQFNQEVLQEHHSRHRTGPAQLELGRGTTWLGVVLGLASAVRT